MERNSTDLSDQKVDKNLNMPRKLDFDSTQKLTKREDPIASLAQNIENLTEFKGDLDLDELKRKQEDLLLLQQMIHDNIQGIQAKINKCANPKPVVVNPPRIDITEILNSDTEQYTEHTPIKVNKNSSLSNYNDLSKSFNRPDMIRLANGKYMEKNRVSMIERPMQNANSTLNLRSKSSAIKRRHRNERK